MGLVSHNVLLIPEHELLCVVKSAHSSGCLEPALAISFRENLVSVPLTQRGKLTDTKKWIDRYHRISDPL